MITTEQLRQNFSGIITECINIETEIFNESMNGIRGSWMSDLLEHENRQEDFPNLSELAEQAIVIMSRDEPAQHNLIDIVRILSQANDGISFSMKQAAKSRAGTAFQNYMERFFDILGFTFETQMALRPGEILDFVFPSLEHLLEDQESGMIVECQTTLKDRFRLSLGKTNDLNEQATKFIATLTGANIITQNDQNDLTTGKIDEIHDRNWRLIALRQVAEDQNSPTVISFEDFVNMIYPEISGTWE